VKLVKKILMAFVAAILFIPFVARAEEKVQVYIFRGEGCPHCEEALEFLDALSDEEKAKFDLNQYEVWNDTSNASLMKSVASALGETASGVPYIVIGEQSFSGYDDEIGESIVATIDSMYENQDLTDVVAPLIGSNNDTIVVVGFLVVVVLLVGGAVVARKKM
jgi:glutaredoxin